MDAPLLPGLTYVGPLGSGGDADVHAYDQRLPERRVAVKVLREPARDPRVAEAFLAEANAMAALEHPFIVGVFSAGIADDGRPYLVMMHCPGPDLWVRCRDEPLPADEVVRVGVQLGGAVETAHRRGLLHRDIKPANILTATHGTVALADFGVAGPPVGDDDPDAGLSVPWAAPEVVFGTAAASVRSDVYSLAATLWTLLVGRSPFERAGESSSALLSRLASEPPAPTGRPDVPPELEAVLATALAKDPAARPASMAEFVGLLQGVQERCGWPVTEPHIAAPAIPPSPTRAGARVADALSAPVPKGAAGASPKRRRWPLAAAAAMAVAVVGGAWLLAGRPPASPDIAITATRDGQQTTFRWTWQPQQAGDTFRVRVRDLVVERSEPTLQVAGEGTHCIQVQVIDARGTPRGDFSAQRCLA